jgi:ribose transport system permease protein
MLNLAIPIALATIAQMFVITGNDLTCRSALRRLRRLRHATWLREPRSLGALPAGLSALRRARRLIHLRNILDRRDARHELRLAKASPDLLLPEAGREGAGLAAAVHGLQAALGAVPDHRRRRHRGGRPYRP